MRLAGGMVGFGPAIQKDVRTRHAGPEYERMARIARIAPLHQVKLALYREPQWWHHPPQLPDLPGCTRANQTAIRLPFFTAEVPELVDQYVQAFEKVWGQRKKLAGL